MDIFTLFGRIVLDSADAEKGLDSLEDKTERNTRSMQDYQKAAFAVGTAITALGAGIEAMNRAQAENTQAVNRLSVATGMQTNEIRALAKETSNATFPLDQVLGLMEQGARLGLEGADALQEFANFWDLVADATGATATELAKSSSALKVVGIDTHNVADATRALGFVQMNTTDGVQGFLRLLEMRGATIREFGLDVDDTAALLAVMEREMGLVGRQARQQFEQALNSADGTLEDLLATLGVTEEQFGRYRAEVDASSNALDTLAEANNATITPLQQVQHWISEQVFANAELIQALGSVSMLMVGLGPVIAGIIPVITGVYKAFMLFNTVLLANPIGLVIIAIAALIAAGVLLWKNWDWVTDKARALWNVISDTFNRIRNAIVGAIDSIDAKFAPFLILLGPLGAIAVIIRFRDEFVSAFQWVRDRVMPIIDGIRGAIEAVINAFKSLPSISDIPGAGFVGNVAGGVRDLFRANGGPVTGGNPYIVGERGPELFVPGTSGTVISNEAMSPNVNISFADGMGWLRNFVRVEMDNEITWAQTSGARITGGR